MLKTGVKPNRINQMMTADPVVRNEGGRWFDPDQLHRLKPQ